MNAYVSSGVNPRGSSPAIFTPAITSRRRAFARSSAPIAAFSSASSIFTSKRTSGAGLIPQSPGLSRGALVIGLAGALRLLITETLQLH